MKLSGITWSGPTAADSEILARLPHDLAVLLRLHNGFILHHGALHVRGIAAEPDWHSLQRAWIGADSFAALYPHLKAADVPFAQDIFGDQFLIRDGAILRLLAETGDLEEKAGSLHEFFRQSEEDPEEYLGFSERTRARPGELLLAYPPFCTKESGAGVSLKACPAHEVIGFHADLARQIGPAS